MDKSKPFGLILTKRAKTLQPKTISVFDSDSDDEPVTKKMTPIPQAKAPSKTQVDKELCEDPSIYEYDSIYDDMKAKEVSKTAAPKDNKPSRYINTLLKAADKRKKEYERRVEKKVQVEREKEGDKFKDKESFVTSAYKKKMQEMEEEEERERRENMLNEMMDVTKQQDLSGFYRHFLKQNVGEENIPVFGEKHKIKEEVLSDDDHKKAKKSYDSNKSSPKKVEKDARASHMDKESKAPKMHAKMYRKGRSDSDNDEVHNPSNDKSQTCKSTEGNGDDDSDIIKADAARISYKASKPSKSHTKTYRKAQSDSDEDEVHSPSNDTSQTNKIADENLDQDSDIVSSDEEETNYVKNEDSLKAKTTSTDPKTVDDNDAQQSNDENVQLKRQKDSKHIPKSRKNIRKRDNSSDSDISDSSKGDKENHGSPLNENSLNGDLESGSNKTQNGEVTEKPKKKINLFEKRTVGEVFAAAQARYFQRMAARNS